jgi:biotin operon repressor
MSTTATTTDLLNALAPHQGAGDGVSAKVLAARLGITTRALRKLVAAAREDGIAICGRPSTGYHIAATADELDAACEFLRRRALHSLRALSRMQRVAMPVLLGQLLLSQG